MLNYSQERQPPKILTERGKNQDIPKLITAHQLSKSKDVRNKLLMQARAQTQHLHSQTTSFSGTDRKMTSRNVETSRTESKLQEQIKQNAELHVIIMQLKDDLQKMRGINKGLVLRLRDLENSYRTLKSDLEKSNQQQQRKLKITIYSDIEEYIKIKVEKLTLNLKQEKMTIALESKLQNFLTELLQINAQTVSSFGKTKIQLQIRVQEPFSFLETNQFIQSSSAATTTLTYTPILLQKKQLSSTQHYTSIMQRLTGQPKMSQSKAVKSRVFSNILSQDSRMRNSFATTPLKRKRIFQ